MNGMSNWLKNIVIVLGLFLPATVMAFGFDPKTGATAYMDAATFPSTLGVITSLESGKASVGASGYPNSNSKDIVLVGYVIFNSELSDRGFTLEVKVANSGWLSSSAAINRCVWVDASCSTNGSISTVTRRATQAVSVRLKRNSTDSYDVIPNGTGIATIILQQYGGGGLVRGDSVYLYFKFNGSVTPVVPTCDVKNFDNNVTLPNARRADIVSHGTGRYTGATKEFTINLACENTPKVSVKFDGDKLSGVTSEDVLANKTTGNDNIGIQLVYNSSALKIGENVEVASAAGANEALKFNAYYYYKGGEVQSGPIKANSEFTFTYQ